MALKAASHVGPYQIVAPLGSGGMGDVYRARDPRLGREVAIKIVPDSLADSAAALERFAREARAVAALQHPNICAIYDIGETNLHRQFIVMELLEGETLQQRLLHGALSVPQIVDLGIAIADALDAAHGAGIIHRDIKPGNIYLTTRGPKLLDFGLAKNAGSTAIAGASRLPTLPPEAALTDPGTTVGTIAYMSPEQVRGDALDARTDLFSFGAVMYEMATGRPPFAGATQGAISGAILYERPVAPRQIRPDLPAALDALIVKALEKDRDLRCQTASELRADLKRLKREIGSDPAASTMTSSVRSNVALSTPAPSSDAQVVAAIVRRHAGRIALIAVAIVLIVTGAAFVLWQRAPAAVPESASLLEGVRLVPLTTSGSAERPAISRDGKYVVYVQRDGLDTSLRIRQTDTSSNVQIVAAQPAAQILGATFTPDGSFVDFIRGTQGPSDLWRVPLLGGEPTRLVDNVTSPIAWSSDGQHMAFVRVNIGTSGTTTALVVADADGSHQHELHVRRLPALYVSFRNTVSTGVAPAQLDWSPDGRVIAVLGGDASSSGRRLRQVVVVDSSSGQEQVITVSPSAAILGLAWLDAHALVLNQVEAEGQPAQLWRMAYPSGTPSRLTNDLSRYVGVSLTADRRSLVTAQYSSRTSIWVGDGNGARGEESLTIERSRGVVRWAGERLLYMTEGGITTAMPGGGTPLEILPRAVFPSATSDGRTIVFSLGSERTLWKADADGRNRAQLVPGEAGEPHIAGDRYVVFLSTRSGQQTVWMVPIDGSREPTEIAKEFASGIDVSPDGRSLLFTTQDRDNRAALVICELPTCTSRQTIAPPDGNQFRWGPDGRSIAYRDAATRTNLWLQPLDGSASYQLTHFGTDRTINDFAWSHDGKRLAVARESVRNDIVLFKGLRTASP